MPRLKKKPYVDEATVVRVGQRAYKALEKMRGRFGRMLGEPCSRKEALDKAILVAERMTDPAFQKGLADELTRHTRENAVDIVNQLLGEKLEVEMSKDGKTYSLKLHNRVVIVSDNRVDLAAAMKDTTGVSVDHMMGH